MFLAVGMEVFFIFTIHDAPVTSVAIKDQNVSLKR